MVDKDIIYGCLDSYLMRRFICGYTTKNYNNIFLDFLKFLMNEKDVKNFIEYINSKKSETNILPSDETLREKIILRPIYNDEKGKSKVFVNILLEIEHFIRNSKQENAVFSSDKLTIEHVMPQKWYEHWPIGSNQIAMEDFYSASYKVYGEQDENGLYHSIVKRNTLANTIGNLTILTDSLNPSLSNLSFDKKRSEILKQSTFKLNTYFHDVNDWNEIEIGKRGVYLSEIICQIWKYPEVESVKLN